MAKLTLPGSKRNLIGSVVASLRKAAGISQNELASRLQLQGWDVHKNAISKIEQGTRSVKDAELCLLAQALGIPAPDLLCRALEAEFELAE